MFDKRNVELAAISLWENVEDHQSIPNEETEVLKVPPMCSAEERIHLSH